jgi:hypothetical protein
MHGSRGGWSGSEVPKSSPDIHGPTARFAIHDDTTPRRHDVCVFKGAQRDLAKNGQTSCRRLVVSSWIREAVRQAVTAAVGVTYDSCLMFFASSGSFDAPSRAFAACCR